MPLPVVVGRPGPLPLSAAGEVALRHVGVARVARRQGEHRRRQVILAEPAEQPPLIMADLLHARAIFGARGALVAAESGRRTEFAIVCIGQTLFCATDVSFVKGFLTVCVLTLSWHEGHHVGM